MKKTCLLLWFVVLVALTARSRNIIVVADSVTHRPLPGASVFGSSGTAAGMTDGKGRLPYLSASDLPFTIRYLGYAEKTVDSLDADTIFLTEYTAELPEVVVESRQHKVLHVLAYVREYSSLSTYTDTVFLFREKMVDYMLPSDASSKFKGWRTPRIINSNSYYRFTNASGLDSVSNTCNQHFSWSDWVGIAPVPPMPATLRGKEQATDTLAGKYGPSEVWMRNGDRLTVDVNVLADTVSRRWVPNLETFFRKKLDYERFRVRFNYDNITADSVYATGLAGYSFNIDSRGRGHDMFRFHRYDEPFFVSTFGEVYILDKEYITVKEARKRQKRVFAAGEVDVIEPAEVTDVAPGIQQLIARVNAINHDDVRRTLAPDLRLKGRLTRKQNIEDRALAIFKTLTGISAYKMHRNNNKNWRNFRKGQVRKNAVRDPAAVDWTGDSGVQ